jgi:HK97 family phage major capsid protein
MNERTRELRAERRQLVKESRKLIEEARAANRDLSADEEKQYDEIFEKQMKLGKQIDREERQIELERETADKELRAGDAEKAQNRGQQLSKEERQMIGFRRFLHGMGTGGDKSSEFRKLQEGYTARGLGGIDNLPEELRDLQADSDTAGGFLLAPMQFAQGLLKEVDDLLFIRQNATVHKVPGASDGLGIQSIDSDPDDFDWTTELQIGNEDSDMAFGLRELKAYPLAKYIKVSRKLLRKTNVASIVRQRLAYVLALTQEKAYLTGDGSQKPLGLFTASDQGISTSRDFSTDNTTTEIKADNLKEVKYSLKAPYRRNARWLYHRDGIKMVSKLKDGDGRYLWQDSIREGEPDLLLSHPVYESEHVPNTFSSGNYVGLFGDLSYYHIADDLLMEMQIIMELWAATNQVGYVVRYEGDGMPALENAFARVKLA